MIVVIDKPQRPIGTGEVEEHFIIALLGEEKRSLSR
jgi:hypothetical protein